MLDKMKRFGLAIVFVILAVQCVQGQVPFPGRCPEVKVQQDFKLSDYMGVWYEYEKYPFIFEVGRKCIHATYAEVGNDSISVVNAAINRFTGEPTNVTGTAKVLGSGQLSVVFPNMKYVNPSKANYEVLETDYTSYSVVYSCSQLMGLANAKMLWVLTRDQQPSEEVVKKAEAVIEANNLITALLMKTRQTGCEEIDKDDDDDSGEGTTASPPAMETDPPVV